MKEEQQGHKIFVEQAMHEMHRGAFDLAVYYLRRAIRVSKYWPLFKNKSTRLEEMIPSFISSYDFKFLVES